MKYKVEMIYTKAFEIEIEAGSYEEAERLSLRNFPDLFVTTLRESMNVETIEEMVKE